MRKSQFSKPSLTNEFKEYLSKCEDLRLAKIDLMGHRGRVAALCCALPQGEALPYCGFIEGPVTLDVGDDLTNTVKLSELYRPIRLRAYRGGSDSLIVPRQTGSRVSTGNFRSMQ